VRLAALFILALLPVGLRATDAWERARATGEIRWGADATGGAPYIYRDPADPRRFLGFEVDLMDALAREMGLRPRLVLVPWEELVPALLRDNFDMAFNGLEITPERSNAILFSNPYYYFSEQITVRKGDRRFQRLEDLRGHRVGTLAASLAYNLLIADPQIETVPYPSPVESYEDLTLGRTDAVLMDVPIAAPADGEPLRSGTAQGFPSTSGEAERSLRGAYSVGGAGENLSEMEHLDAGTNQTACPSPSPLPQGGDRGLHCLPS
jgi:polar amino acid transport system substrate-binding protein